MLVKAVLKGFYDNQMRDAGSEFEVDDSMRAHLHSECWMQPVDSETVDFSRMNKKQLSDWLVEKGVEHEVASSKNDLLKLCEDSV